MGEEVTFPRDVPLEEGMPAGWKAIERMYGPNSKTPGRTYTRYHSADGKYKHICSPKQVITLDCEAKGEDPALAIAEYHRLLKERSAREAEVRQQGRDAKGQVKGELREEAIARFTEKYGSLNGPMVSAFPGWVTRWHYQPNCNQVMVEYIDTDGGSWKLLKDLEAAFQVRLDRGDGGHIPGLIEAGQANADAARFGEGKKMARTTGGTYELAAEAAGAAEGRAMSREAAGQDKTSRRTDSEGRRVRRRLHLNLAPDGPKQSGWAGLESQADVEEAFARFRTLLVGRGFKESLALVSVRGVSEERFYAQRLRGVYYQMGEPVEEQACYQKLLHFPQSPSEVGCDGIYIVWSSERSRWEITTRPSGEGKVVAYSAEATGPLAKAGGPWHVQDGQSDFREDKGLVIMQHEPDGKS